MFSVFVAGEEEFLRNLNGRSPADYKAYCGSRGETGGGILIICTTLIAHGLFKEIEVWLRWIQMFLLGGLTRRKKKYFLRLADDRRG